MIFLDLPTGEFHGWGIVGDSLASALGSLASTQRLRRRPDRMPLPGPLLQSIGHPLRPDHPGLTARRRVGYAVFEKDLRARRVAAAALGDFDAVATACSWCEDALRAGGLDAVTTVLHGVDTTRFNPSVAVRTRLADRFVVFSGGKFEFRKGQDIAAKAFEIFAEHHANAFLVAAWHNPWLGSAATMALSPHLRFSAVANRPLADSLLSWLADAGIDLERVELVPNLSHGEMAAIYGNTDVGLFPNRCEGATNLVLMEYMACGKPTIVTDFAGHRDIVTDDNSFRLRGWRPTPVYDDGEAVACWCEPDLDEVVECLEQAYADWELCRRRGQRAGEDAANWTWDLAARRFLELLEPTSQ